MPFILLVFLFAIVFSVFPEIDIQVAAYFFDGERFYNKREGFLGFIYQATPAITITTILICFMSTIRLIYAHKPFFGLDKRAIIFLLATLAVGPGIISNAILKTHWDRARPVQIEAFGGSATFTPALVPSDQCDKNCSFVSGHAAIGFFVMAFGFVYAHRKYVWISTGIATGLLAGLARIAQGGHFLSDVLFAGCVVYATLWGMHWLLYKRHNMH